jgi:hypothetical protein
VIVLSDRERKIKYLLEKLQRASGSKAEKIKRELRDLGVTVY